MEFKMYDLVFWCVLEFSTEVPRTVASFWSHAAHTTGAACTTNSPHWFMDGKHLEACSMGIKDSYMPRMGGETSMKT